MYRACRNFFVHTLISLVGISILSSAHAGGLIWPVVDSPKHWLVDYDSYHLSFDGSWITTDHNFDKQGTSSKPINLDSAMSLEPRLHAGISLGNRFSLFAQASLRKVNDDYLDPSNSATYGSSSFGLGDAFLAGRWLIFSNRQVGGRFATAREIAPGNFRSLIESGILVPPYSYPSPPLGNRTIDWQTMWRNVWFPWSAFAVSMGFGYTWRSYGTSPEIPYSFRMDYYFPWESRVRLWAEAKGWQSVGSDPWLIPLFRNGSLLYGSGKSSKMLAELGFAAMLSQSFELAISGATAVKGSGIAQEKIVSVGIAYRPPAQTTVGFYNPRRDLDIGGLARRTEFDSYDIIAPIIDVSRKGNYFKIGYGSIDHVHIDDEFHLYQVEHYPKSGKTKDTFIGRAGIVAVKADSAFLRLEAVYDRSKLRPGLEARRVRFKDEDAPRKILKGP